MSCFIGCLALATPRLTIVLVVIFSHYIGRAYETMIWPLLGFVFMPLTTLAYAWAVNSNGSVSGVYLVVVVLAVLMDLGMIGGGEATRRHARR
jgi:hypothetical protein